MEKEEFHGPRDRAIEICKNLKMSIEKAKQRVPQEFRNNLTTNPSATAKGLQKVMDNVMKKHGLTKKDLK
mgnify:CR=1 FL=1|tara:strand:- start:422 stop:631 length:210 start_codon:yes stop_codon:yes gene_type:complete